MYKATTVSQKIRWRNCRHRHGMIYFVVKYFLVRLYNSLTTIDDRSICSGNIEINFKFWKMFVSVLGVIFFKYFMEKERFYELYSVAKRQKFLARKNDNGDLATNSTLFGSRHHKIPQWPIFTGMTPFL